MPCTRMHSDLLLFPIVFMHFRISLHYFMFAYQHAFCFAHRDVDDCLQIYLPSAVELYLLYQYSPFVNSWTTSYVCIRTLALTFALCMPSCTRTYALALRMHSCTGTYALVLRMHSCTCTDALALCTYALALRMHSCTRTYALVLRMHSCTCTDALALCTHFRRCMHLQKRAMHIYNAHMHSRVLSPPERIPRHLIEQNVFFEIPHPTNDFYMFRSAHRSRISVNSYAFCLLPYIPLAKRPCWIQANTICNTATEPELFKTDIKSRSAMRKIIIIYPGF